MRNFLIIPLFLISFASCKQKDLTLEQLQKAKWDSLAPGIYYISTGDEKGIASRSDLIELSLKGISGRETIPADTSLSKISGGLDKMFSDILKSHRPESKAGYFRVNLNEMMRRDPVKVIIYLTREYDTLGIPTFSSDSTIMKNMPGIEAANYISKEAAKEKYIADGNKDWSDIIDENPLPASIELNLDNREWTEESLNKLKTSILDRLMMVSDIYFPTYLYQKSDEYYFFQYKRK